MGIEEIFAFAAQQQVEMYNRIAAYKEKEAAHQLLTAQIIHKNAQQAAQHTKQIGRPSLLIRPTLTIDGEEWVATHGACQGRGPTPDLAYQDFDSQWVGKES